MSWPGEGRSCHVPPGQLQQGTSRSVIGRRRARSAGSASPRASSVRLTAVPTGRSQARRCPEVRAMITVVFTEAEARAAADAMHAYIDDDYYPAIDLGALKTAFSGLTRTIASHATRDDRSAHGSVLEARGEVLLWRQSPLLVRHKCLLCAQLPGQPAHSPLPGTVGRPRRQGSLRRPRTRRSACRDPCHRPTRSGSKSRVPRPGLDLPVARRTTRTRLPAVQPLPAHCGAGPPEWAG
jgi:hypothetical protein